jgi:hypothetical protein
MKALFFFLLIIPTVVRACPTCEVAQPRILRGITHGIGPDSHWDYLIVLSVVIFAALTLFYSVKWLIRPGEAGATHIKRFILNNEQYEK